MGKGIIKMYRDKKVIIVDGDNEQSVKEFLDIGFSLEKPVAVSVPDVEPVSVLKPKRGKRVK